MYDPNNMPSVPPDYEKVLRQLIEDTAEFDTDEPICGADFVEWFADARLEIKTALRRAELQAIEEDRWQQA